jgi:hypothetical protein
MFPESRASAISTASLNNSEKNFYRKTHNVRLVTRRMPHRKKDAQKNARVATVLCKDAYKIASQFFRSAFYGLISPWVAPEPRPKKSFLVFTRTKGRQGLSGNSHMQTLYLLPFFALCALVVFPLKSYPFRMVKNLWFLHDFI